MNNLDIIFINTNSAKEVYQELSKKWSAIEPPTWSLLLAESCRSRGFEVAILDANAEDLTHKQTALRILKEKPKFACFVTYGQNPNSGTSNMVGVYEVAKLIKESGQDIKIISIGSHTAALPQEVICNDNIDFVAINEGVYVLHRLLEGVTEYNKIPALCYKENNKSHLINGPNSLVSQAKMDVDLPGYAWDLLPYNKIPFDLYRAHIWHAEYQDKYRSAFASIYTSLGCKFKCNFCMINTVNRTSNFPFTTAAESNIMRFWSPEHMIKVVSELINKYNITTLRLCDEMFFLNKKYYEPLLTMLKDRGYGKYLKMWSYARVDTVNERFLDLFKEGGINWLALGIEAANQNVRAEIEKGKFRDVNIRDVVRQIKEHGMYVGGNYIVGHPNENYQEMQETLDLALELNTEFANFYTSMALPGSPLYYEAKNNGWKLPETPEAWSFHSYECQPLPTKYLTPQEVLKFRDEAWNKYFTNPNFLSLIESKFGQDARTNIEEQSKIKLKRKILGD